MNGLTESVEKNPTVRINYDITMTNDLTDFLGTETEGYDNVVRLGKMKQLKNQNL